MTRPRKIKLQVRDGATRAIANQALYYREQSPDSRLGERWEKAVARSMHSLADMPERGARCGFTPPKLREVRRFAVDGFPRHSVFYLFLAEELIVQVIDVVHGARDIGSVLG
jgi:plasmid stabilization system protein ParE